MPSARLEEQFQDEPGGSVYAEEGTAAHALAEHKLKKALKRRSKRPVSDYHCDEMEECTDGYVAFAMEQVELARQECKDPVVLIEQRLDYSAYVPEGFGTGDLLIVADHVLTVIDLKYGKGVAVEAEWNPQMMLYGLGALELFTCRVICGKCGAVYWRRTWTRGSRKIRVWQCGKRYQQKGVAGCKGCNLFEKDLEKAFLMAWNGIVENREGFLPAWKKQITEGNALEKWRAGQMVQLTAEPPLETICPEIVNMVLESVEVHDGGLLHFHFLDGTELEIETEE